MDGVTGPLEQLQMCSECCFQEFWVVADRSDPILMFTEPLTLSIAKTNRDGNVKTHCEIKN